MPSAKVITLITVPVMVAALLGIGLALRTDSASEHEAEPTDGAQEKTGIAAQSEPPTKNTTSSQFTFPQRKHCSSRSTNFV